MLNMSFKKYAKLLGRRGGRKRAVNLSPERRSAIASLGGRARAESFRLAKRIDENFLYLNAVLEIKSACERSFAGDAQDLEFLKNKK